MPPVFADDPVQNAGTIFVVGSALITSLFAWLTTRDKLRFDADRVAMVAAQKATEVQLKALTDRVTDCEGDRAELREKLHEHEHRGDVRQAEIDELRRRLDDRSAVHRSLPD